MRKFVLGVLIILVFILPCFGAVKFTDLRSDHWAYNYVAKLVDDYKVISGFPDNTFRGGKSLSRYEFAKGLVSALQYIESTMEVSLKVPATAEVSLKDLATAEGSLRAPSSIEVSFKDVKPGSWPYPFVMDLVSKYQIVKGYPDGTFKGKKSLNRNEIAQSIAKALALIEKAAGSEIAVTQEAAFKDLPATHWAYPSVRKLAATGIISGFPNGTFRGKEDVSRYSLAVVLSRFIDYSITKLKVKVKKEAKSEIEKAIAVTPSRQVAISGLFGNVYEKDSGTNNWMGFGGALTYGDTYKFWRFSGNYELTGKYGYNQIVYFVPAGGGLIRGGVFNENRFDAELNLIQPLVQFWGLNGKLLTGVKYVNFNNSVAPCDFTGVNVGVATALKLFGRDFLARAFYTYPVSQVNVTPSILGQPKQLFDYEASVGAKLFSYPVLVGFSGETMTLSGGSSRNYNNFFVRYFLL